MAGGELRREPWTVEKGVRRPPARQQRTRARMAASSDARRRTTSRSLVKPRTAIARAVGWNSLPGSAGHLANVHEGAGMFYQPKFKLSTFFVIWMNRLQEYFFRLAGCNSLALFYASRVWFVSLRRGGPKVISKEFGYEALLYSLEHRVALVDFSQNDCYTTLDDNPLADFFLVDHEPKVRRHGKMQKFVFLETREAISSMLRPHWARRIDGKAHVILIQAQSDVLEVVPLGTSKVNGVKILLESLWASPNEVMALGDGENDKEMLQLVGLLVSRSPTAAR
uniref:Uncharacterized protein n=1 Tax=Oryza nivara TaxID=4536 RepID=A0A0E0IIV8_ORYNI